MLLQLFSPAADVFYFWSAALLAILQIDPHSEVERSSRFKRRRILIHLTIEERQLKEVLSPKKYNWVSLCNFTVPLQEPKAWGLRNLKLEHHEDLMLSLDQLILCEAITWDFDQIFDRRWVNLFILHRDQ